MKRKESSPVSVHKTCDAAETKKLGLQLGKCFVPGDIVVLTGALGAGKTVLVQGVADALGIIEPVTSPTFTLVSEYSGTMKLYHIDLYRLVSPEEFTWLGLEEMLNGTGVSLIEWGELAEDELPERTIHIGIDIVENGDRLITVQGKHQCRE